MVVLYDRCPVCNERCKEGVQEHLRKKHMGSKRRRLNPAPEFRAKEKLPASWYRDVGTEAEWLKRTEDDRLDQLLIDKMKKVQSAAPVDGAAAICAECPECHMLYIFTQDSPWIGERPADNRNEHQLVCLCGHVSFFDPAKLSRYLVKAEVYRRGYGSAEEVPLFQDNTGEP